MQHFDRRSSGCVVYKVSKVVKDDILQLQLDILLVRSKTSKNWSLPKGGIEPFLTSEVNAIKEVWEEAGVTGILGPKLGSYRYLKGTKTTKNPINDVRVQHVTLFAMQFGEELDVYPESEIRERKWFKFKNAIEKVDEGVAPFLFDVYTLANSLEAHKDVTKQIIEFNGPTVAERQAFTI